MFIERQENTLIIKENIGSLSGVIETIKKN